MTSIQPSYPQEFPFYLDIQVRYADLDTQQHVNNVAIMVMSNMPALATIVPAAFGTAQYVMASAPSWAG